MPDSQIQFFRRPSHNVLRGDTKVAIMFFKESHNLIQTVYGIGRVWSP